MRKVFVITLFLFFLVGCEDLAYNPQSENEIKQLPFKVLALGDSYTIGESVKPEERWPAQLARLQQSYGDTVESITYVAKTGWTTKDLLNGIEANRPDSNYSLVTLLIGVNNQFRGYNVDVFRSEYASLLKKAIIFAGGSKSKVLVLSIPDYSVTPRGKQYGSSTKVATELLAYNQIKKEITDFYGVEYVDIWDISKWAADNSALTASDGLHPSGLMYEFWSRRAADSLYKSVLK